jgi:porin
MKPQSDRERWEPQLPLGRSRSNKPKIDLSSPFGPLTSLAQVAQSVGGLLGANSVNGLPANFRSDSWFAIANVSQYLYVKNDPVEIAQRLKSGQPLDGVGLFARIGYAPPETNPITQDYSVALIAHGLLGDWRTSSAEEPG